MIEQLNTIDTDSVEFCITFCDGLRRHITYEAKVASLRSEYHREYWWRCQITDNVRNEDVMQHFFAPTYEQLKEQLINFIVMYFNH